MVCHRVRRLLVVSASAALMTLAPSLDAQDLGGVSEQDAVERDWSDEVPAHLAVVDGDATIERDGRLERAEPNLALLAGDRLQTRTGRLEILFADGSVLDLDASSTLDLLSESLIRLLAGQLRLSIVRTSVDLAYRIDTPAASAWIRTAGDYRIAVGEDQRRVPQTQLTVWRGSAELANTLGRTLVRPGTYAIADSQSAPSLPYATNSAAYDDFDQWAEDRRAERLGASSSRYLPTEVRYESGVFDRYGSWAYQAPYGYVWYPRVSAGWRPYRDGRWSVVGHFGWFWVGLDRWSWTTHHYGRWGVSSDRWYWIPGNQWAPAWVSWAAAPGYVSWCPLGYDNRAVYRIGVGSYPDLWSAWTILPTRYFVSNVVVRQHLVVHTAIGPSVRGQFVEYRTPPRAAAPPLRPSDPLRAPTGARGTAVPRSVITPAPTSRPASASVQAPALRSAPSTPGGMTPDTPRIAPSRTSAPSRAIRQTDQAPARSLPSLPSRVETAPARTAPPAASGSAPWVRSRESTVAPPMPPAPRAVREPVRPSASTPGTTAPGGWAASRRAPVVPDAVRPAPTPPSSGPVRSSEPSGRSVGPSAPSRSASSGSAPGRVGPPAPPPAAGGGSATAVPRRGRGGTY